MGHISSRRYERVNVGLRFSHSSQKMLADTLTSRRKKPYYQRRPDEIDIPARLAIDIFSPFSGKAREGARDKKASVRYFFFISFIFFFSTRADTRCRDARYRLPRTRFPRKFRGRIIYVVVRWAYGHYLVFDSPFHPFDVRRAFKCCGLHVTPLRQ